MNKILKFTNQMFSGEIIGYLMILTAGTLWGTIGLFVKLLNGVGATSSLTSFMRLFMGFCILIPIMFFKGGTKLFKIDGKGLFQCFLLGTLSQALFNYCYTVSIGSVGVATASILLYTAPVFVCVMSKIFFKELIGIQKVFALALNITGCFLMVTGGNLSNLKISSAGIIFGLTAAFMYSLVTIIGKITSGNINPFTVVFYSFLFGWIVLGIFTSPWKDIADAWSFRFLVYSIGYGFIPTVGSYLLYMGGLCRKLELSKVPVIASVETVVASLIGVIVFKEKIGLINMFGIIILIMSIAIMNLNSKKTNREIAHCNITEVDKIK
ncbi:MULTISPECIES: DMT family transporter [unclassified Sedimentibacter]|uniref:DMT family transporter n=1 Tax=unclassified Sedimentibacter TaxID=2649220 RepID=UPI0027E10058|nr:EamA family transporter [Sedimentibacter sp. MB35-C1]WMJ78811.1 EamA family transporter [Sedimentibacter sp. MB35-C1]